MAGGRRRALGQHFLRDARIARAIVDLVAPSSADLVVEIGPGEGALTGELARRAGRVIALEVDRVLIERLRRRLPAVEVLEADARSWEYGALARPAGGRVLVVGNLPYSVGKPILQSLVEARTAIDEMALMLQLEVAERVAATPGSKTYGSLSVLTQLYCDVRIPLRVPPGAFRPPPKVESAVLYLRRASHRAWARHDFTPLYGPRSPSGGRRWPTRSRRASGFRWRPPGRPPRAWAWTRADAPKHSRFTSLLRWPVDYSRGTCGAARSCSVSSRWSS